MVWWLPELQARVCILRSKTGALVKICPFCSIFCFGALLEKVKNSARGKKFLLIFFSSKISLSAPTKSLRWPTDSEYMKFVENRAFSQGTVELLVIPKTIGNRKRDCVVRGPIQKRRL